MAKKVLFNMWPRYDLYTCHTVHEIKLTFVTWKKKNILFVHLLRYSANIIYNMLRVV